MVLTGVDIASYGADLPGAPTLGQLVRRLLALVPELPRLRLSSLDPAAIDDDLWRLLAEEPRLMPHLHLSLQAGSDLILKRMKRRHSRADALAVIARARALRPGIAIGADLIAGFPTETDALFAETLALRARGRAAVPARVPLQRAPRHAGRAHAAGADAACAASAPRGCAQAGRGRRARASSPARSDATVARAGRDATQARPHASISPRCAWLRRGARRGCCARGVDRRVDDDAAAGGGRLMALGGSSRA